MSKRTSTDSSLSDLSYASELNSFSDDGFFSWDSEEEDSDTEPSDVDRHIAHLRLLSWLLITSSATLVVSTLTVGVMVAHSAGLIHFIALGPLITQILNNPYVLIAAAIIAVVALAVLIPSAVHCSKKVRIARKRDVLRTLFGCKKSRRKDSRFERPVLNEQIPRT